MAIPTLPSPPVTPETRDFWAATAEGRLLIPHCKTCGKPHYYPRAICPHCFGADLEWIAASGRGTVYSFSVMLRAKEPYVLAYVRLEEGVTMLTNIVDCPHDTIAIGNPVRLCFAPTAGEAMVPVFTMA